LAKRCERLQMLSDLKLGQSGGDLIYVTSSLGLRLGTDSPVWF
jgi:hypothetical protein